jgi:hypothetical protein
VPRTESSHDFSAVSLRTPRAIAIVTGVHYRTAIVTADLPGPVRLFDDADAQGVAKSSSFPCKCAVGASDAVGN